MFELTSVLNEYAKNYQANNEIINDDDIIKAIYCIDNLAVNNEIDVLLYLLSLNLCNAYAKIQDTHDIYKFKKSIGTFLNIINEKNIPNIKICKTNNNGNLYIFKVFNIQFSFHDEKIIDINEFYYEDMLWDGIKKQPCAKTLFDLYLNNASTNSCITTTGKPIKILIEKLINDYHHGIITFDEIIENI